MKICQDGMKMKKVVLLFAFLILFSSQAFGQLIGRSVGTKITATIDQVLSISTNMPTISPVDVVNSSSAFLGEVTINSNYSGTWYVVISSRNRGQLRGQTPGNSDNYPYTFYFGDMRDIDLSSDAELAIRGRSPKTGLTYRIGIDFTRYADLSTPVISDSYFDEIVLTVMIP